MDAHKQLENQVIYGQMKIFWNCPYKWKDLIFVWKRRPRQEPGGIVKIEILTSPKMSSHQRTQTFMVNQLGIATS